VGECNLLGINQAAVSKMERRADMYISTLQSMIRAIGTFQRGDKVGAMLF